jgi:hypothetical protein
MKREYCPISQKTLSTFQIYWDIDFCVKSIASRFDKVQRLPALFLCNFTFIRTSQLNVRLLVLRRVCSRNKAV